MDLSALAPDALNYEGYLDGATDSGKQDAQEQAQSVSAADRSNTILPVLEGGESVRQICVLYFQRPVASC